MCNRMRRQCRLKGKNPLPDIWLQHILLSVKKYLLHSNLGAALTFALMLWTGFCLHVPFDSQEWSISDFSCSLTGNYLTTHNMENLTFHHLLRWKPIILPIITTSHIYILRVRNWEKTFSTTQYGELDFSSLTQMKADHTIKYHYLTYIYILRARNWEKTFSHISLLEMMFVRVWSHFCDYQGLFSRKSCYRGQICNRVGRSVEPWFYFGSLGECK